MSAKAVAFLRPSRGAARSAPIAKRRVISDMWHSLSEPLSDNRPMINRREFMGASWSAAMQTGIANEKIRQGREAAMAVLKPSRKDLEHGLELHANSLVVES